MRTRLLFFALFLVCSIAGAQNLPKLASGSITRVENFKSEFVSVRNVDIWLPEAYDTKKKYSVVYMHDGQMLFDSTTTWNKKEWKADETFSQLIKEKKIVDCILVAIWNTGADRIAEYLPNKIYNLLDEKTRAKISDKYLNGKSVSGDNYLKFLVTELKPYVDNHFSTYTDKDHTWMIGSSMGAIISIYAICEYPDVFSGVACLSTAWLSQIEPSYEVPTAAFEYLKKNLPSPFGHKIYMDYGSGEGDKTYAAIQYFVDVIAKGKGFNETNYLSKIFEKAEHNEVAWSVRLNVPLEFLMPRPKPQIPVAGKIDLYENFGSKYITERNVEVWLPENYSTRKKYAVLYMHDGQMLFDSTTTWNHQSWDVDNVATKLLQGHKVQDFIVVGVSNGGKTRHADYFPQKPFESLTQDQKDFVTKQLQGAGRTTEAFIPVSDNYLKFLVTELKPFIDKKYPVHKDRSHTFIAGSSMGGLISMYAICEYPKIFGGAACMSTHWPGIFSMEGNPVPDAFVNYMKKNLPDPKSHKIYFDYGDQTLDAMYPPLQKKVDDVLKDQGYTDKNWMTKFFPGKDHSEKSWNQRFNIPLEFLMKN